LLVSINRAQILIIWGVLVWTIERHSDYLYHIYNHHILKVCSDLLLLRSVDILSIVIWAVQALAYIILVYHSFFHTFSTIDRDDRMTIKMYYLIFVRNERKC
jgi:hypothetical protein